MSGLDRYMTMLAEKKMRLFDPEADDWQWRVSADEWGRLTAWSKKQWGWTEELLAAMERRIGGILVTTDAALPPRSVILEPKP